MSLSPLLQAHEVTFCYPSTSLREEQSVSASSLAATSLVACTGELIHIDGRSGSGKSTLARCLTGLIPHLYRGQMAGEVWLGELPTHSTPLWQLAERAGLLFQNPAGQMLAQSVCDDILFGLENLGLPRTEMARRLSDTLDQFGLTNLADRVPQTLSGGEQQKLALAAITARQPAVLVLDEPLSMLDGTAACELIDHLALLAQRGTAVLVCEHRAEYLAHLPNLRRVHLNGHHLPTPHPADLELAPLEPFTLQVENLSVRLGKRTVLDQIGFRANGGTVVAVVGRNGAGKTTLLRALAGLQEHSGTIHVNGERPDLGLVFQNADLQLFNASVRDEILFRIREPDLFLYRQLIAALGLARYEETPPLLLSEGEKKRLALATVLMRQPRHGILLDEPALGQDAGHKQSLLALARALAHTGRLVILTTHDLTLAAGADRLLLLGPNGLTADGPPHSVLRDDAAWARLGLAVPPWVHAS